MTSELYDIAEIDEIDLSDFGFDDADFSMDFKTNNPLDDAVLQRMSRPILNTIRNKDTIIKAVTQGGYYVLPESYRDRWEELEDLKWDLHSLLDKTKEQLRPTMEFLKEKGRNIQGTVDKLFPPKLAGKYKDLMEAREEHVRSNGRRELTQEEEFNTKYHDILSNEYRSLYTGSVGRQAVAPMMEEKDGIEVEMLAEQHKTEVEGTIAKLSNDSAQLEQSSQLNKAVASLVKLSASNAAFNDRFLINYYRKSLDLQHKHYFVTKRMFALQSGTLTAMVSRLDLINENSSLPDAIKHNKYQHRTHSLKEMLLGRQDMGGISKGTLTKQLRSGLLNAVTDNVAQLASSMGLVTSISDTGMSSQEMITELAKEAMTSVGKFAGKQLGKRVLQNDAVRGVAESLELLGDTIERRIATSATEGAGGVSDIIRSFVGSNFDVSKSTINHNLMEKATEIVPFDLLTRRSIIDIIPGYLSRILEQVTNIATGEKKDRVVYSVEREDFVTLSQATEDTANLIKGRVNSGVIETSLKLVDMMDRGKTLSDETRNEMAKYLAKESIANKVFDPVKLHKDADKNFTNPQEVRTLLESNFGTPATTDDGMGSPLSGSSFRERMGSIASGAKQLLRDPAALDRVLLDPLLGISTGGFENKQTADQLELMKKLSKQFDRVSNRYRSNQDIINMFSGTGQKELLRETGLVTQDGGTRDSVRDEFYWETIDELLADPSSAIRSTRFDDGDENVEEEKPTWASRKTREIRARLRERLKGRFRGAFDDLLREEEEEVEDDFRAEIRRTEASVLEDIVADPSLDSDDEEVGASDSVRYRRRRRIKQRDPAIVRRRSASGRRNELDDIDSSVQPTSPRIIRRRSASGRRSELDDTDSSTQAASPRIVRRRSASGRVADFVGPLQEPTETRNQLEYSVPVEDVSQTLNLSTQFFTEPSLPTDEEILAETVRQKGMDEEGIRSLTGKQRRLLIKEFRERNKREESSSGVIRRRSASGRASDTDPTNTLLDPVTNIIRRRTASARASDMVTEETSPDPIANIVRMRSASSRNLLPHSIASSMEEFVGPLPTDVPERGLLDYAVTPETSSPQPAQMFTEEPTLSEEEILMEVARVGGMDEETINGLTREQRQQLINEAKEKGPGGAVRLAAWLIKAGGKTAANIALGTASWVTGGTFPDIYVQGEERPRITSWELRRGMYFDSETGKPIKNLSQIKGEVIDKDGNFILTKEDVEKGLVDVKGSRIKNIMQGIASMGMDYADLATRPHQHIAKFAWKVLKQIRLAPKDIYVEGEFTQPRLTKGGFNRRDYYDGLTGKPLRTHKDIRSSGVMDVNGDFLLTPDEIRDKKLFFSNGKEFKISFIGRVVRGLKNLAVAGVRQLGNRVFNPIKNAAKLAIGKPLGLAGDMSRELSRRFLPENVRNTMAKIPGVGRLFGQKSPTLGRENFAEDTPEMEENKKQTKLLERLLRVTIDPDDIGGVGGAGSWMSQLLRRRRKKKEEGEEGKDGEGKKGSNLLGKVGSAIGSGAMKAAGWAKDKILGGEDAGVTPATPDGGKKGFWSKAGQWITGGLVGGGATAAATTVLGGGATAAAGTAAAGTTAAAATGAAAGGGMLATVGTGLAAAGGAIASFFTLPVLVGLAAVAAIGFSAYLAWKAMRRRRDLRPLEKLRFLQYGMDTSDEDALIDIRYFEEKTPEVIEIKDDAMPRFKADKYKKFWAKHSKMFGREAEKAEDFDVFNKWFTERYAYIYQLHLWAARLVTGKKIGIYDIDAKLTPEQKLAFLKLVSTDAILDSGKDPFRISAYPWKDKHPNPGALSEAKALQHTVEEDAKKGKDTKLAKAQEVEEKKVDAIMSLKQKQRIRDAEKYANLVEKKANERKRYEDDYGSLIDENDFNRTNELLSKQYDGERIIEQRMKARDAILNGTDGTFSGGTDTEKNLILPADGRISSPFGDRDDPFGSKGTVGHKGIDIALPEGTPLVAAKSGVVTRAEMSSSYGNVIYINHDDGTQTRYAHMRNFARGISTGSIVRMGQVIGYSGNTGNSTGPHLHFELRGPVPKSANSSKGWLALQNDRPTYNPLAFALEEDIGGTLAGLNNLGKDDLDVGDETVSNTVDKAATAVAKEVPVPVVESVAKNTTETATDVLTADSMMDTLLNNRRTAANAPIVPNVTVNPEIKVPATDFSPLTEQGEKNYVEMASRTDRQIAIAEAQLQQQKLIIDLLASNADQNDKKLQQQIAGVYSTMEELEKAKQQQARTPTVSSSKRNAYT